MKPGVGRLIDFYESLSDSSRSSSPVARKSLLAKRTPLATVCPNTGASSSSVASEDERAGQLEELANAFFDEDDDQPSPSGSSGDSFKDHSDYEQSSDDGGADNECAARTSLKFGVKPSGNPALDELYQTELNYVRALRQAMALGGDVAEHVGPVLEHHELLVRSVDSPAAFLAAAFSSGSLSSARGGGPSDEVAAAAVEQWLAVYAPYCALAARRARQQSGASQRSNLLQRSPELPIEPTQRLARYSLLLRAVAKNAARGSVEAATAGCAAALMARVSAEVDRRVRAADGRSRVHELASLFQRRDLAVPWRRFIREGTLKSCCSMSLSVDFEPADSDGDEGDDEQSADEDDGGAHFKRDRARTAAATGPIDVCRTPRAISSSSTYDRDDDDSDDEDDGRQVHVLDAGSRLSVFLFNDCVLVGWKCSERRTVLVRQFSLADTWVVKGAGPDNGHQFVLVDHVSALGFSASSQVAAVSWARDLEAAVSEQNQNPQAQSDRDQHKVTAGGLICPLHCRWRIANGLPGQQIHQQRHLQRRATVAGNGAPKTPSQGNPKMLKKLKTAATLFSPFRSAKKKRKKREKAAAAAAAAALHPN